MAARHSTPGEPSLECRVSGETAALWRLNHRDAVLVPDPTPLLVKDRLKAHALDERHEFRSGANRDAVGPLVGIGAEAIAVTLITGEEAGDSRGIQAVESLSASDAICDMQAARSRDN